MKNKKILIISIIIAIVVIACGIGGFLYYQNMKANEEEYNEAVKKYERIENTSNQVNDAIDAEVSKANKFIATNPDVGEDKSSIENLKSEVTKLEELKIEIEPKASKITEINSSIEKMENQIKQVDEELLKNEDITDEQNEDAKLETTENKEISEVKFSENSNFNILTSNIKTLTNKVNEAVKVETDRKAEAERKAKEEAEKKKKEEILSKIAGSYSCFGEMSDNFWGTYRGVLDISNSGKVAITEIVALSTGKTITTQYNIKINTDISSNDNVIKFTLTSVKGGYKRYFTYNSSKSNILIEECKEVDYDYIWRKGSDD